MICCTVANLIDEFTAVTYNLSKIRQIIYRKKLYESKHVEDTAACLATVVSYNCRVFT